MGLKKLKKSIEKKAKGVVKGVVGGVTGAVTAAVKGESATTVVKNIGQVYGSVVSVGTNQAIFATSSGGQKRLASDGLNKATFGTTKEIRNVGQGFNQLSSKQTVNSSFYKSSASLLAKGYVGAKVTSSAQFQKGYAQASAKTKAWYAGLSNTQKAAGGVALASGNFKKAGQKLGLPSSITDKLPDGKKDPGSPGYSADPTATQVEETKTDTSLLTVVGILGAIIIGS